VPTGIALVRKKAEVLEALAGHLTLENAAQAAGVSRRQLYIWRQEDADFEAACNEAKESALDRLEDKAYEVALNKDDKYYEKDSLLNRFFILKGYRPQFKDAARPEVDVREVRFTFEVPRPEGLVGRQVALPEHIVEGEVISAG
jgi:hypothetical protein